MNFKTKYRIVRDKYCGYEAQFRPWYSPVWWQCFGINSGNLETARQTCDRHFQYYSKHNKVIEHYEPTQSPR